MLIGDAGINVDGGTDNVEGFESDGAGKVEYGGSNDTGSCGTLQYVRIEYAGFELSPDNELNGLTVAGCGSGTVLDFIQVHRGQDTVAATTDPRASTRTTTACPPTKSGSQHRREGGEAKEGSGGIPRISSIPAAGIAARGG